jgi:hypothetical protein
MTRQIGVLFFLIVLAYTTTAQETLPNFTVVDKGNNRILASWTNSYGPFIRQLSIQRSADSIKNFKTILTLPDPTVPQNGYLDTKAPGGRVFYRIFILLDSGKYIFSHSKRAAPDTAKTASAPPESVNAQEKKGNGVILNKPPPAKEIPKEKKEENNKPAKPKEIPERIINIKKRDTLIAQIGERSYRRYRDSMLTKTKDTIAFSTPDTLVIRPFVPKEVYKASVYVFTGKDGNVRVQLPDATGRHYALKFFEMDNSPVFEIKQIREGMLIIDKTNFLHSGWFKFELYEDGHVKERSRLFIPKDF